MDRKILLGLLVSVSIILAFAILLPSGKPPEENPKLPWRIAYDEAGRSEIFGIVIGKTTLKQAQETLQAEGETNLFAAPDGKFYVETYFQRITISGLKADLVLALVLDNQEAEAMFNRGARQKLQETGNRKVELASEDYQVMAGKRIAHITYIPSANLDEKMITHRFGEPSRKVTESEEIEHWLYPDKGLDIALNIEGKEILQYVNREDFGRLTQPLNEMPKE